MDVCCKTCGTEYEFDAARIGPKGVKVKCTACDSVFSVRASSQVPSSTATDWLVRTSDDRLISFEKLTTLQKWIIEGRIEREDEISRDRESWKQMGNVPELEPFFSVFDRASALNDLMNTGSIGEHPVLINGSEVLATANPIHSTRPASQLTPPPIAPTIPAKPRRTSQAFIDTQPIAVQDRLSRRRSEIQSRESTPTLTDEPVVSDRPSFPPDVPTEAVSQEDIRKASSANQFNSDIEMEFSGPSDFGSLDLENEVRDDVNIRSFEKKSRIRRRALGIASLMIGGLVGGAIFALYGVPQSPISKIKNSTGNAKVDEAALALSEARQKFEQDSLESLDLADQTYEKAIEASPENIDLLPIRSLVMTTWAGQLRRVARLKETKLTIYLDARKRFEKQNKLHNSLPPEAKSKAQRPVAPSFVDSNKLSTEIEKFRKQASMLIKQAFELIRKSNDKGASSLNTLRALADYYRVQRDQKTFDYIRKAEALRAQSGQKDPAILFIEAAAMFDDKGKQDSASLAKIARQLEEVLTLRPTLVRARVLLARLQSKQNRIALAKSQLMQVLEQSPNHTEAQMLLSGLKSPEKPKSIQETVTKAPTKTAEAKPASTRNNEPPQKAARPKKTASRAVKSNPYQTLLKQGRKLRKENLPWKALLAYEKAAELNKSSAAPYIGIGWCYLELGKPIAALNQFKKASLVDPKSVEAYLGQGRALTAQGKLDQAVKRLEQAIEMSPRSRFAKRARKTIAEIEDSE